MSDIETEQIKKEIINQERINKMFNTIKSQKNEPKPNFTL